MGLRWIREMVATDHIACDLTPAAAVTYTERDDTVRDIEVEVDLCQRLGVQARLARASALRGEAPSSW